MLVLSRGPGQVPGVEQRVRAQEPTHERLVRLLAVHSSHHLPGTARVLERVETAEVAVDHCAGRSPDTSTSGSGTSRTFATTRPWVATTWATSERTSQSLQGVGRTHWSAFTPARRAPNPSATRRYRCDTSVTGAP